MTETVQSLAADTPMMLRQIRGHFETLTTWARKQTLKDDGCDHEFADSYAVAAQAIAELDDLTRRFEALESAPDEQGDPGDPGNEVKGILRDAGERIKTIAEGSPKLGAICSHLTDAYMLTDDIKSPGATALEQREPAAATDDEAPDFNALNKLNPLIECDLYETLDNATDVLEFLSGLFVYGRGLSDLFGSDKRRGGVIHQLDAAITAIDFVAGEISKQIHGPALARRAGGAA